MYRKLEAREEGRSPKTPCMLNLWVWLYIDLLGVGSEDQNRATRLSWVLARRDTPQGGGGARRPGFFFFGWGPWCFFCVSLVVCATRAWVDSV